MGSKALFESRELGQRDGASDAPAPKYMGVERRRTNRRVVSERRTEVRFEPGKEDRRQNQGRRADDKTPVFW